MIVVGQDPESGIRNPESGKRKPETRKQKAQTENQNYPQFTKITATYPLLERSAIIPTLKHLTLSKTYTQAFNSEEM